MPSISQKLLNFLPQGRQRLDYAKKHIQPLRSVLHRLYRLKALSEHDPQTSTDLQGEYIVLEFRGDGQSSSLHCANDVNK